MRTQNIESQTVTVSALIRLTDLSRERVKRCLAGIKPENERRGAPVYRLAAAIKALVHGPETAGDREKRLRGDLLEQRLARMKGEQLDAAKMAFESSEILIHLRQAIMDADIDRRAKTRLAKHLKHELETLQDRLADCLFPEALGETENGDEKNEND